VKALQWLLTHSLSGKALAVRRVTENHGKRTPGIDGEIWSTPASAEAGLYPEIERKAETPRHSDDDRSGDAGVHLLALDPVPGLTWTFEA
jgi:hypothetical protein